MTDPAFPLPFQEPNDALPLRLSCPACSHEWILDSAHLGRDSVCPGCQIPVIANPGPAGQIAVERLDQTPSRAPSSSGAAASATSSPARRGGPSPLLIGLAGFAVIVALLAVATVSLRRSGRLFDFARPERIIPTLVPVASAPMEITVPGVISAPPKPQSQPQSPQQPLQPEPGSVPEMATPADLPVASVPTASGPPANQLPGAAEKALRAFLAASRPWEKLMHVLEPEEDLLSILDFKKLDPIDAAAPVRELETLYAATEQRWISFATVPEKDGSLHTLCLVHRTDDGTAKLDFSLYWQNRSDRLLPFVEGEPKEEPLTVRAELRRLTPGIPGSALRLSVGQAYASFAPVEITVPAASPIAAEIAARPGIDTPTAAIVELVWSTGESKPTPTISRIVQWGLWAPEG